LVKVRLDQEPEYLAQELHLVSLPNFENEPKDKPLMSNIFA